MTNSPAILSVDFEFFSHTPAYRKARGSTEQEAVGKVGIDYLLNVLEETDTTASFFVVSEIADRFPDLLRRIVSNGHEIGSHGRTHVPLSSLDEPGRREEIRGSRIELEEVTGEAVKGFRAPVFDITNDHFDLVNESGYRYDSSIAPTRRIPGFYGGEFSRQRPGYARDFNSEYPDSLLELPISVMPIVRTPLSGAWMRFFGREYTAYGMRYLANLGLTPVLYVHPWEFVDLPQVPGVPKRVYWRTGQWMRETVRRLLSEPFEFITAATELERHG